MSEVSARAKAPVIVPGRSSESAEVSWWQVHVFLETLAAQYDRLPIAGTPAWCAMSDGDPRKVVALAVAGEHHVLRCELDQIALAEASKSVAAAADWGAVARWNQRRARAVASGVYIPRRAS